jgi:hypothetical protein
VNVSDTPPCQVARGRRVLSCHVRPRFASARWLLTTSFASAFILAARPAAPQFTSYSRDPRHILEGSWQSCRGDDGRYTERVYDHLVNGVGQFEVHMGPRDEFGIFAGVQDAHRDHASAANLLQPYRVANTTGRAMQRWDVPSLNLTFTATLAGGSRGECESWFVLLEQRPKPSH